MKAAFPAAAIALTLGASACAAPHIQPPLTPPPDFAGAHVEDRALVMSDGARLPYLRWGPTDRAPWAVIVALHGMNDHDASFRLAGPWWAEQGIETWAYDQRGFGAAPGRGVWAGQQRMTDDLREVTALARARYPDAVIAVVGESMGGSVAAAAFGSDNPPDADRLVLLAPGVWGWSTQGPLNSAALNIAARALGDVALEPPEFITRDIHASSNTLELIRNGRYPMNILATRFDTVYGLVDLMETASRSLGRIRGDAVLMYGAHDEIVKRGPMRLALERAQADGGALKTAWYPNGWHLLNRDLDAEIVYRDVAAWLRNPDAALPSGAPAVLPELEKPAAPDGRAASRR
ncbi:MAG: lysophospholipase [Alphaproteobacteria bacterium]|nr:lysophospholipase [Alphaproteobacteria bacterium]